MRRFLLGLGLSLGLVCFVESAIGQPMSPNFRPFVRTNAPNWDSAAAVIQSLGITPGSVGTWNGTFAGDGSGLTGLSSTSLSGVLTNYISSPSITGNGVGLTNFLLSSTNTAYVSLAVGNDATAVVGDPKLPSLTITNAFRLITAACPSNILGVVKLTPGDFYWMPPVNGVTITLGTNQQVMLDATEATVMATNLNQIFFSIRDQTTLILKGGLIMSTNGTGSIAYIHTLKNWTNIITDAQLYGVWDILVDDNPGTMNGAYYLSVERSFLGGGYDIFYLPHINTVNSPSTNAVVFLRDSIFLASTNGYLPTPLAVFPAWFPVGLTASSGAIPRAFVFTAANIGIYNCHFYGDVLGAYFPNKARGIVVNSTFGNASGGASGTVGNLATTAICFQNGAVLKFTSIPCNYTNVLFGTTARAATITSVPWITNAPTANYTNVLRTDGTDYWWMDLTAPR